MTPIKPENRRRYPKDWARRSRFVRFYRARNPVLVGKGIGVYRGPVVWWVLVHLVLDATKWLACLIQGHSWAVGVDYDPVMGTRIEVRACAKCGAFRLVERPPAAGPREGGAE